MDWRTRSIDELPGDPYPLAQHGINQNDLSTYLAKTTEWTDERMQTLRNVFVNNRSLPRPLVVYRVKGELVGDSVAVTAIPILRITEKGTHLTPMQDHRIRSSPSRSG